VVRRLRLSYLHERLCASPGQRLEIRDWRLGHAAALRFGDDCFGERMFGIGFDSGGLAN